MGLSVIVRITLKDGAYHEVCDRNWWHKRTRADMRSYRTSVTAISRIAKGKPPLLRRPRKKGLQMPLNEHYGISATCWVIVSMTRIMLPR